MLPVSTLNAEPIIILIVFSVCHEAGVPNGGTVPSTPLAAYRIDPLVDWSIDAVILAPRDLPPLLVSASYSARTGSFGLFVGRDGRDLCCLGNFVLAPTSYLSVRLSADTFLTLNLMRVPPHVRAA